MLNIDDPKQTERTHALWRLGFRPFFLGGAIIAALYIPLWLLTWFTPQYSFFAPLLLGQYIATMVAST